MPDWQRIEDVDATRALAAHLNATARTRPVVVVTIPAGHDAPWIDVDEIAREAGDLAEVYLMPTGAVTWEFTRHMAEGTQVYGGAGRVYPVGREWVTNLSASPLRFAFSAAEGRGATAHLISDAWRMAAAAGLTRRPRNHQLQRVSGTVKAIVARRALVEIGNLLPATIAQELTVDGVPITRVVTEGLQVEGSYDGATNRLDVTEQLRPADEALAAYAEGDVVHARVDAVREAEADLTLYPGVTVTLERADVTLNPLDDLRTLLTQGEVVGARVASPGPAWRLVLNDVDDDEPVLEAPSLLAGGPPWLVEETEPSEPDDALQVSPTPRLPEPEPAPEPVAAEPAAPAVARPTPRMLDRKAVRAETPSGHQPPPAPPRSTTELLLQIDALKAEIKRLTRENAVVKDQVTASAGERDQLRFLHEQERRRANRAEHDLKAARRRLRTAGNKRVVADAPAAPQFGDREQGFRYLVLTQWATRTTPGEQRDRPLPEYVIGPQFLDSLERLEGIKLVKVADVAFEIVTGLAAENASREVHRLRTGPGGDDPVRTRDADGAKAWRASLQVKSPSARRIHYWVLPDGQIELARVTTHDDMEI